MRENCRNATRNEQQLTKQPTPVFGDDIRFRMYAVTPLKKAQNIRIYHCFTTKSLKSTPEPTGCLCGKAWSICLPVHENGGISIGPDRTLGTVRTEDSGTGAPVVSEQTRGSGFHQRVVARGLRV